VPFLSPLPQPAGADRTLQMHPHERR
jgi:hypothetical protein